MSARMGIDVETVAPALWKLRSIDAPSIKRAAFNWSTSSGSGKRRGAGANVPSTVRMRLRPRRAAVAPTNSG